MELARCNLLLCLCLCVFVMLFIAVDCAGDKPKGRSKKQPAHLRQASTKNSTTLASKCSKESYREMDVMVARMTSPDDRFPETIKELQARCQNRTGLLAKVEDLKNRCMEGLVKRVVAVVLYSMKRQRKTMCRKKASKKMVEMVGAGKCINAVRPDAQRCVDEAMDHIIGIRNITDNKMKIPFVCCTFVKLKACLLDHGHKNKQCTEQHLNLLLRQSEQVSNGPMNMACGDYNEESDRCDKLVIPKRQQDEPLPKSFLMPLVELFDSFEE